MNLKQFTDLFREDADPFKTDDEGFGLIVDAAEGALRCGVALTLSEYAAMTPELRRAFVLASNRIDRDRASIRAAEAVDAAISGILDDIEAEAK